MTVKELREIAKVNGIKGYSKMNKAQLEDTITNVAVNEMISSVIDNSVVDNSIYSHDTTPADGQGLCGLMYGAYLS
jgi:hypothetical protein